MIDSIREERACQMEGCAAVDNCGGGGGRGATWLGEVHVCGLRTVLWCDL